MLIDDRARSPAHQSPAATAVSARSFTVRVALFYAALFVVYGAQLPFLPLWLDARGLTPAEIGLATSLPLFARLLVTPSIAVIADRSNAHARIAMVLAAIALAASLMLPVASGMLAISGLILLFLVSIQSAMPLVETIAMRGVRTANLDYGRMRLWGSVTFIAANLAGGFIIDATGRGSIAWMLITGNALTLIATALLPAPASAEPAAASTTEAPDPVTKSTTMSAGTFAPVLRLLRQPPVVLFLIATGAIQASHAVFYTFGAVHWRGLGMSSHWIGALWAIGVVVEVALFAFSARAVHMAGARGLLLAGGMAGVIRWVAMAFDPPLAMLIPLQVLHAATFGATHLAAMHLITELVDERDAGTAQSLHATVTAGIAMGGAIAMAGPLYAALGSRCYLAMAVLAAVGLAAAVRLGNRQ